MGGSPADEEQQPLVVGGKPADLEAGGGGKGGGDTAGSSALQQFLAQHKIPLIIFYYGFCSSTLIVINKVAVHNLTAPVFILILQLLFAAGTVKGCAVTGVLEAEPLRWGLVRPFLLIVAGFLGTLYANIKVLMYSNVETFITFRSSTPLVLSLFDYIFLGRELPGGRSVFSLVLLLSSCAGYTYCDQGFKLQAYSWLCVWYCFFLFEACYVKYTCDTVAMTNWGRVYYTNFLSALALLAVFPACKGEHALLRAFEFSTPQVLLLGLSCAVGVCMSHAGYLMRSNVSATAGVVVGVVCKIGSVALNLLIWDQHASPIQLAFLALGLAGGSMFRQAPLRAQAAAQPPHSSIASSGGCGISGSGAKGGGVSLAPGGDGDDEGDQESSGLIKSGYDSGSSGQDVLQVVDTGSPGGSLMGGSGKGSSALSGLGPKLRTQFF